MHGRRSAYYIVGEGVLNEPDFISGGRSCPVSGSAAASAPPSFRFGRMFPLPAKRVSPGEGFELGMGLIQLGLLMNKSAADGDLSPLTSDIPSGYTYLGQFIAHEITFDNTQDLPPVEPDPRSLRSPSLDLDSIYGGGPNDERSRQLYDEEDTSRLKVGKTFRPKDLPEWFEFDNDLYRDKGTGGAIAGDKRNDENLAVAQTTVAFIRFHNKVVETLKAAGYDEGDLFDCARKHVVRHFQWLVLRDYLPRIVDAGVLERVINHGPRWFKVKREEGLFMPLEFSAAAFRLGHSMVRPSYEWNYYHSTQSGAKQVPLNQLFQQTAFSGTIGDPGRSQVLPSEWVIDWRRFYRFPEYPSGKNYPPALTGVNMASRIDTVFDLHLDQMPFDHGNIPSEKRSLTVRNLLRGFALGLPTGEEVAECMGETPLCPGEVARGPHREVLSAPAFRGKTPLWYYVLKEAELNGGSRLGAVGSRIVAETFVGLIKNSRYSILREPRWYPKYTRRGEPGTASALFEMPDLLDFAGVVNPIEKQ